MELVLQNVYIVDPDGEPAAGDIGIEGGVIREVAAPGTLRGARTIDGTGLYAFPAFCDMHCHLRDPGQTHKEDLISGSRAAAAGGYSDICCMPNTKPPVDSAAIAADIRARSEAGPVAVHPIGAVTRGMQGGELTDFAALSAAGAIAFSDDGLPVESAGLMGAALEAAGRQQTLIMAHEEDRALAAGGSVNAGPNAERAGLAGIPPESETDMVARDLNLAAEHGGRLHLCHMSTAGSMNLIRKAKKTGAKNVTCETAPHYFSATDDFILSGNPNTKMNPPLRSERDRQAVIAALQDGTIDVIATDHAPHAPEEKDVPYGEAPFGIIGLETAFPLAITHLYAPGLLSLGQIARLMSTNPRRILGLPGGTIQPGQPADIALCDIGRRYVYGEDMVVSRSRNSPFLGMELQGCVVKTIRKGNTVYDRPSDR